MNLQSLLTIISLFCFSQFLIVKGASYQSIYDSCQNNQAACVIVTLTQGYNVAWQSPVKTEDRIDCALSGSTIQTCSYKSGGGASIHCNHSNGISISVAGSIVHATLLGNAAQTFSTSGINTSIFTASCLTKG